MSENENALANSCPILQNYSGDSTKSGLFLTCLSVFTQIDPKGQLCIPLAALFSPLPAFLRPIPLKSIIFASS
jgi:hypothetical protein